MRAASRFTFPLKKKEHMKAAVIYEHGGAGSIQYETDFPDPVPGPTT